MVYETIRNSFSSSVSKEWSFRSTTSLSSISNSGSTNNLLSHIKTNIEQSEDFIPCIAVHHPYYPCIATLKTPNHHHITCLAVHNKLLYAASGNQITTFDLTSLSPTPSFNGQDLSSGGFIKSIAILDDNRILTAHQDSKIRVWKRHRFVTTLPTMKDKLRRFICPRNYVQVRRHKKKLWIKHNDAVSGLTVHNGVIYSVSWDKTLKIWRASDFKCLESITAHEDAVNSVTVSNNGTVYTGSADGKIRVWKKRAHDNNNVWCHTMVTTMHNHGSTVNALALSKNGRVLLSGGCDGIIMAWEKSDGDGDENDQMVESGVVGGHDGAVLCLIRLDHDFGDDHEMFVSGGADRTVRIWGRSVKGRDGVGCRGSFCCVGVLEGHKRPVRSVTLVNEGGENGVVRVFSGSLDGEIKVWRVLVYELIQNRPSFIYS